MRFLISSKKRITDEMSKALAALQDLCATVGTSADLQLTNDDVSQEYTRRISICLVEIFTPTTNFGTSTDLQLTNDDGWKKYTSIRGQVKYGYL